MKQSKLKVVQQEMARVNINILGISELKTYKQSKYLLAKGWMDKFLSYISR